MCYGTQAAFDGNDILFLKNPIGDVHDWGKMILCENLFFDLWTSGRIEMFVRKRCRLFLLSVLLELFRIIKFPCSQVIETISLRLDHPSSHSWNCMVLNF